LNITDIWAESKKKTNLPWNRRASITCD